MSIELNSLLETYVSEYLTTFDSKPKQTNRNEPNFLVAIYQGNYFSQARLARGSRSFEETARHLREHAPLINGELRERTIRRAKVRKTPRSDDILIPRGEGTGDEDPFNLAYVVEYVLRGSFGC